MWISASFETRAYPETRQSCPAENEHVFMALLPLKASSGNEHHLIEPGSNPNRSRIVFENWILTESPALDQMG